MTRALIVAGVSVIAASIHAQDLYAPMRPTMRRGPELAKVTLLDLDNPVRPQMRRGASQSSRQTAIAKALIAPDTRDLMVLLGMPDLWPHRDPELVAAVLKQPPQPIVPEGSNRGWRPATLSEQQPASLVQPPPGPVLASNPDVAVTVSPMSRGASERILGKRIGKIAMVWLVTLENRTLEPVQIAPSAIYRHVGHLQPFDHIVMSQLIEEGVKNSFLARSGRAADDVGKLSAFMIASKTIQIAETWPLALVTGAGWAIPYLIQRLKGAETPVSVNFERLAWVVPIALGPGETANAHIFSELWDNPSPISFTLDVSRVALRKSLQ